MNESFFYALSASNWVATNYINAETGRNFTSWGEFFGPREHNGDFFTATVRFLEPFCSIRELTRINQQRYNLSNAIFDEVASGAIVVHGYNGSATPAEPYKAEDIILVSGLTCLKAVILLTF